MGYYRNLEIQAQLSKYFDLSGNIEKYFESGYRYFLWDFYFDYERL